MKKFLPLFLCVILLIASLALVVGAADPAVSSDVTVDGVQPSALEGDYSIRFVGTINNIENYKEVGFTFTVTNAAGATVTKDIAATSVFTNLMSGEDVVLSATDKGVDALYAIGFTGIVATDAYTITVTPYAVTIDGDKVEGETKTARKFENEGFVQIITAAQFNAIASALDKNVETTEKYYVTGTITKIDNKNIYVTDAAGEVLHIYGMTSTTTPSVGDVVTVYGIAKNYNGNTPEMMNAEVKDIVAHAHVYTPLANKCNVCGAISEHGCVDADSDTACDRCGGYVAPAGTKTETIVFSEFGYTNQQEVSQTVTNTGFVVAFTDGSYPTKWYDSGTAIRLYTGGSITITAPTGCVISSITFTFSGDSTGLTADGYSDTESTWTGSSDAVEFTASAQARIQKIKIGYTGDVHVCEDGADEDLYCDSCGKCIDEHTYTYACSLNCANPNCSYVRDASEVAEMHDWQDTCYCHIDGCGVVNQNAPAGHHVYDEKDQCQNCRAYKKSDSASNIDFEFGDNGEAGHKDGSAISAGKTYTSTSTSGQEYTLTFDSVTSVYGGALDAKGNSALKLGTSSKAGEFSFTVPDDVTSVVIYVAQYKAKKTTIEVNGTQYVIETASDNGEYTKITIDTTTNKTVTLTTISGGYRAMIDKITYKLAEETV